MSFVRPTAVRQRLLPVLTLALCVLGPPAARAAGVTIVTHGFNGNADGWVLGTASRISAYPRFPGTNVICYEVTVTRSGGGVYSVTHRQLEGGDPRTDPAAEVFVKLDWGAVAGLIGSRSTIEIADAVAPRLLDTNFIAAFGGHALTEFPLHIIGHSRGGSLVCELSRALGARGVWVHHATALDPHPLNNDGNPNPIGVTDGPLRVYENVLFADNVFQNFGGYPSGQAMPQAFNRQLTALPGGYSSAHSDVHLWYHASIDFGSPASDTEAQLQSSNRAMWFAAGEALGTNAGFRYSRLGGGDRLGVTPVAGAGSDWPARGMNQRWDFGAGATNNRTALPANSGEWPNLITLELQGTNVLATGQTGSVAFRYQWAVPSSNAVLRLFLDNDLNPLNGSAAVLEDFVAPSTGPAAIGMGERDFAVAPGSLTPGDYFVGAAIHGGGRSRFLYANETVTVTPPIDPPILSLTTAGALVNITVHAMSGQRVVLERTRDFASWQPLATNVMAGTTWPVLATNDGWRAFYRAAVR